MEVIYYILMLLLVLGVPALLIYLVIVMIKPGLFNKWIKGDWSRGKIFGTGLLTLFGGIIFLSIGINTATPQSIRDEIEASNAAAKQVQDGQKQKVEVEKQDDAPKSEIKSEVIVVPTQHAVIEKVDSTLPSGQRRVVTAGVAGERTETYSVTYLDGEQVSRNLSNSEITKIPVDEVVSVGAYIAPSAPTRNNYSSSQSFQQQSTPSNTSVYYANCSAARAAGAAPVYRGEPGYRSALDRDNDGIGCE